MITIHPFGSHLPALMGCVANTDGRVLELGSGVFSTPMLHAACGGRELVTADSDPAWMQRFLYLQGPSHRFELVDDWAAFGRLDEPWDVAFVDQSPGHARTPSIERLRDQTRLIVVHDTNAVAHYKFEPLLSSFAHRQDFLELGVSVRTTVVSDVAPVPFSIPPVTAHHAAIALGETPIRLEPTGSRWHGRQFPWPASAGHFFLVGQLTIDARGEEEVAAQAVYLDGASRELFWMDLLRGALPGKDGAFCLAQEAAAAIPAQMKGEPDPQWSEVRAVTVRAKANAASLSIDGLGLLALPALSAIPAS